MIKQIYLELLRKGRVVHTATVRNDWTSSDYQKLAEDFPGTYIQTSRITYPTQFLGMKSHHTDFNSMWRKVEPRCK